MQKQRHNKQAFFCGGFTLLELLAVLVIIAILAGLILGAAQLVIRTARGKQAAAASRALRMALVSYRHDYGHWPVPASLVGSITTTNVLTVTNSNGNALIFDMLRFDNATDNKNQIRYLDDTTLYTVYNGQHGTLYAAYQSGASGPFPVGYLTADGNSIHYFTVTLWFDLEKAEVWTQPGDY